MIEGAPSERRRRAAVMADVGRLAGVSHQTVSRVINGSTKVRPETRDRVLAAMRELDYRPNPVARALVMGRSRMLGVVSFDTTLYGPASTLFGIERAAHQAGYFTIVASLEALTRSSVVQAVARLRTHGVDGVLVIAPYDAGSQALPHAATEIPLVAVEAGPPDGVPVVSIDQFAGAVAATRHLLGLGHRTVWHVSGPADFLEARQRVDGWRHAMAEAGLEPPEPLIGDWSPHSGYELGCRLAADPSVTAVFVANDQMALGLLRAMSEAGRDVPGDVSVIGFDDIPEAPFFTPPLTTVRQDFDAMGNAGVRLLLELIDGEVEALNAVLEPELVVRGSTGPCER